MKFRSRSSQRRSWALLRWSAAVLIAIAPAAHAAADDAVGLDGLSDPFSGWTTNPSLAALGGDTSFWSSTYGRATTGYASADVDLGGYLMYGGDQPVVSSGKCVHTLEWRPGMQFANCEPQPAPAPVAQAKPVPQPVR
jgi:hypothetical protein